MSYLSTAIIALRIHGDEQSTNSHISNNNRYANINDLKKNDADITDP